MQRSEHRILTTHAGSLPRPTALTRLYAQRAAGGATDAAEIEAQGRAAVQAIVSKQIETGLAGLREAMERARVGVNARPTSPASSSV